ncbi:C4-dicarboxylate TRAP transporter large permease protein DctM [Moorella humiferrea]|uniref:TRAP transporter large permease n=1 Tax=Neomoorella humiferrea TaxID=676965 RepID=UPI0030D33062
MLFLVLVLLILILINMPIAFALSFTSLAYLLLTDRVPLRILIQQMFTGVDSFVFLAVPFFILAGTLMERGGISQRLIDFSASIVGRIRGGLAMSAVLAAMIFASISGSGPATTAAIGGPIIPALRERGYGKEWSAALMASAGVIGPIIPPSITMVIYGAMTNTSIASLFLGGAVPGILIGLGLMVICYFHARKVGVAKVNEAFNLRSFFLAFKKAVWALGMPALILGGILGGFFTPTEAAVVSVVYGLFVAFFIYRSVKISDIPGIVRDSAITTAVVMIVLANAAGFAWLISAEQGPEKLVQLFLSISNNKFVILLLINILLFILGCFIDTTSSLVMTVPTLVPLARAVGIDPLHLGLIICVNTVIGMATPPLGLTLFTACSVGKVSIAKVTRPILPMLAVMVIVTLLITYVPSLVLYLPSLFIK